MDTILTDAFLVTRDELLQVCKEIDTDTPVAETTRFIQSAHIVLKDRVDGKSTNPNSPATMALIELYLSAHFAAITYAPTSSQSVGKLQESVQRKLGLGLENTTYGQQAMMLDRTGILKKINKSTGGIVSITSLSASA